MQRKPGFPVNCSIKMPDLMPLDSLLLEEDGDQQQRRQQLINFGHSQWGFNNWSWSVTKQDLDFVDFVNGKYSAGVVAFVSVAVKSFDIHRENIGYATCVAPMKGSAIYQARKCAVTNALKETLISFGGNVTTELLELLESHKHDCNNQNGAQQNDILPENNQNLANKPAVTHSTEPKNASISNAARSVRKDSSDSSSSRDNSSANVRSPQAAVAAPLPPLAKNVTGLAGAPLVAKAHPMPANQPSCKPALPVNQPRAPPPPAGPPQPPAPPPPAPHHVRPNSNEPTKSDVLPSSSGVIASVGRTDAEARAERKRRQRLAQEEFRQRHLARQPTGGTDAAAQEMDKHSIDSLLLDIQSQDVPSGAAVNAKRKSDEGAMSVKRPALATVETT